MISCLLVDLLELFNKENVDEFFFFIVIEVKL